MLENVFKKFLLIIDIVTIGFGGWIAGLTMSSINEYLQFIVLLITIAGLIWRMFKPAKK